MPAVSVRSTGPDLEALTDQAVRGFQRAQREVGREVARGGAKAIKVPFRSAMVMSVPTARPSTWWNMISLRGVMAS